MTFRQYVTIMLAGTLLCFISTGVVLFTVDPFLDPGIGHVFFYLCVFLSLVGLLSLGIFVLYYHLIKKDLPTFRIVKQTFVQGALGAALLTGVLYLQGQQLLNIWNIAIGGAIILFFLLFRFSVIRHNSSHTL